MLGGYTDHTDSGASRGRSDSVIASTLRPHSATVLIILGALLAGFLLGSFRFRRHSPVSKMTTQATQIAPAQPARLPATPATSTPIASTPMENAPLKRRAADDIAGTDRRRRRQRTALGTCLVSLCAVGTMLITDVRPVSFAPVSAVGADTEPVAPPPVTTIVEPPPGPDCARVHCVALTFDDGPDRYSTPALLDILEARDVPATFFVLGHAIAGNEDIIRRMARLGMAVENHTWDHSNLAGLSAAGVLDQLTRTDAEIHRVTGEQPRYMRPPFGAWTPGSTPTGGMRPVLWEVDPQDWLYRNSTVVTQNVVNRAGPGDIILLHDIHQTSVDAIPSIIDGLEQRGFTFVLLDDIYDGRPDCAVHLYCGPAPIATTTTSTPSTGTTVSPSPSDVRAVSQAPA